TGAVSRCAPARGASARGLRPGSADRAPQPALQLERLGRELVVRRAEQEGVEPTALLHRAQGARRDAQPHGAAEAPRVQRDALQVGREGAARLAVRVRDVVAEGDPRPGQLAAAGHRTLLLLLAVAAPELVDLAAARGLAHLPGPERMAHRRDLEPDHRHLLAVDLARLARGQGRAGHPLRPARAVDEDDLVVVGMDAGLHGGSLPARLAHAGQLAGQGQLAQRDPGDAELVVVAARAAGDRAAVLLARRAGVAGQLGEGGLDGQLLLDRDVRVLQLRPQLGA